MSDLLICALCALATFIITVLISKRLIPYLKSKKMGQPILEIGPRWHKSKEGTPTMGGLAFIIASLITGAAGAVYFIVKYPADRIAPFILTMAYGVLCALTGMIDDLAKLRKKQNEGLSAKQKFALQVVSSGLYLAGMCCFCGVSTTVFIPYFNVEINLGIAFYFLAMLLLTGMDNSVNLTDGIDGLSSSVTLVVSLFFGAAAYFTMPADGNNVSLLMLSSVMLGATAGFLVYNFYPARVFMGDTGSLFLGALVVGGAFILGNPLIVVVAGFVYIAETLSVILQVGYFKLTHGKRLFKMAPIHHHFEKCGFSEIKIVVLFTAATVVMCAAAWLGLR